MGRQLIAGRGLLLAINHQAFNRIHIGDNSNSARINQFHVYLSSSGRMNQAVSSSLAVGLLAINHQAFDC